MEAVRGDLDESDDLVDERGEDPGVVGGGLREVTDDAIAAEGEFEEATAALAGGGDELMVVA